jgi:putative Holliday junction resolvase
MAFDVGDRRIGIAVTDDLGLTAQPLFTLHRTTERADLKSMARFLRQHKVSRVVIGLPLNADGSESPQAVKTRRLIDGLRELHSEAEFHWLDERLTTREAHALLDIAGKSSRFAGKTARLERSEIIDQVAAVLILEAFLAQETGPALLPDPESQA